MGVRWNAIKNLGQGLGQTALGGASKSVGRTLGMKRIASNAITGAAIGGGVGAIGSIGSGEGFGRSTIRGAMGGAAIGAGVGATRNFIGTRKGMQEAMDTLSKGGRGSARRAASQASQYYPTGKPVKEIVKELEVGVEMNKQIFAAKAAKDAAKAAATP